jgi:hypothetical protein
MPGSTGPRGSCKRQVLADLLPGEVGASLPGLILAWATVIRADQTGGRTMTTAAQSSVNWTAVAAPIAVSVAALAFTILSFWWLQARRGRLVAYVPHVYAANFQLSSFRLRLPLTVYNTGARTLVVTELQLVFPDDDVTVPVITFRKTLKPLTDDVVDFAHPFAVSGRDTASRFVEFGTRHWSPKLETRHRVRIEVRTGDAEGWSELLTTSLVTPTADKAKGYIAHPRDSAYDAARLPEIE